MASVASAADRLERLTEREREVITKLGLRDRTQVVIYAYESDLIAADDRDIGH